MRMFRWPLLIVALALMVSGCQSIRDLAGQGKRPPDEFTVYSRTPLSMPPNFSLTPPVKGAVPEATAARADARQALLGGRSQAGTGPAAYAAGAAEAADSSPGLAALLERSGGATANSDIRAIVNRETTILAEADATLTDRLMFWRKPEYGTVVDPAKEARRIQDNQALGKPIIAGATPTIERKRRALLEGIF